MVTTATTDDSVQWRFVATLPARSWSGASSSAWPTAGNWLGSVAPTPDETVIFNTA